MRRWFVERGLGVVIVTLAIYVLLAPTHVVDGDNAEFATVGALGGRAHPSGYPAYVMYLRATSWLPGASAAHTAALATVVLSVLTVLVLHAACRAWGTGPGAASVAVALYAASPVVLRMHTEAEVFGPNALVVATVLWFAASQGPLRGVARAAALGLTAGLGLGNHLTCALVAPVGLLGVLRGIREAKRSKVVAGAAAVAMLLFGLSTYAYLFIADGPVSFGRVASVSDLLDFFLRTDYGGPGAFLPGDHKPDHAANLAALANTLGRAWLWLPAVAGVGLLFWRCARARSGEGRLGWLALAVSWTVAGPLLALRFNVDPEGLGLYVSHRFHLLPLLLLTIPVAAALDLITERLGARRSTLASPLAASVLGAVILIGGTAASLPWLRAVHSPAMQLGVRNMLRSLPPNAIVIANSDDMCMGADYLQHVEGERPDIVIACWTLTSRQWYRDRLSTRGLSVTERFEPEMSVKQAANLLATGRPVLVDRSQKLVAAELPSYPYSVLIRLLPRHESPPSLREVVDLNRRLYEGFELGYPHPRRGDDYAAVAHKRYAATWVTLAGALEKAGDAQASADALDLAVKLAPSRD